MSYANGLGNLQNLTNTIAASDVRRPEGTETAASSAVQGGAERGQDQTQFSTLAGSLGQALSGTDVRTAKVAELSAAIAAGSYQVSSSDVAGKMIDALLR